MRPDQPVTAQSFLASLDQGGYSFDDLYALMIRLRNRIQDQRPLRGVPLSTMQLVVEVLDHRLGGIA
jgi:hypothetical protein